MELDCRCTVQLLSEDVCELAWLFAAFFFQPVRTKKWSGHVVCPSQWVVLKVFPRSFQGHLAFLPPFPLVCSLQTWSLAVLDIWLRGLNLTHIPLYWYNGLWLIFSRPGLCSCLHCGHRQCSRPAWCGHGGELWQGPE